MRSVIRLFGVFCLTVLSATTPYAQDIEFDNLKSLLRQQIFSGDTATYNDKKITLFEVSVDGNVRLATNTNPDTLHFNLLRLRPVEMDSGSKYNRHGLGLYGRHIDLFIEETVREDVLNDQGELIRTNIMLPVHELRFTDRAAAESVAEIFIRMMAIISGKKTE
jgi:hypothetical protein